MSRFSRLDFEAQPRVAEPLHDPWPNLDAAGCLRMADDQFQTGLYEAALASYSRALRFNKDLPQAWAGQVRCLICLGEYPEAVTWSIRALERFPDSADLLACRGLALTLAGNLPEGAEYLDGAVAMRSPSAWVWLARGESLLATRQPEANAQRCFMKALEAAPKDWHLEMRIGMAYNRARMYARARGPLLSALRGGGGGNPMLLYHLGLAHEASGEFPAAAGYYERARAARRDFGEAEQALTRVKGAGALTRLWWRLRAKG